MKKIVLVVLVFFISQSIINAAPGSFLITGNITGLRDSTLVFLARPGQPGQMLANGYAQKGKFILFGKVEDADVYQLSFIGLTDVAEIFLTAGKLTVTGDIKSIRNLSITGTNAQQDYQYYNSKFDYLKIKLGQLSASINQTPQGLRRDSMIYAFEDAKKKVIEQVDAFVKAKPASPVTPFVELVTSPVSNDMNVLEQRYNAMVPALQESFYGREILKTINASKIGMEGSESIDFTQNDTADHPVALSSFKGKYVLVDFWASWCRPCRMENPNVVTAYNNYKNKNFTVLGVSLDQVKENWVNAINADNLTWTHVSDLKSWQNAAAQLYHIQSIPANMLIDPSGKIIGKNLRGEALEATLARLLK